MLENWKNKDWLYQKYIVEKLSANDIAKIVHHDPKTVWTWLRKFGIQTRPRGTNQPDGFCYWKFGKPSPFKGKKQSEKAKEHLRALRKADGHVPYLKNGVHWLKTPGAKPASWKGGVAPQRSLEYSKRSWKSAVKAVWKRANAKCELCGKDYRTVDRSKEKFNVHHVYSFAEFKYLRDNPDNLMLLCSRCHKFVHSKKNKLEICLTKEGTLPPWISK